jgi:hypothetical protein
LAHPTPSSIREPPSESSFRYNAIGASKPNAISLPSTGRGLFVSGAAHWSPFRSLSCNDPCCSIGVYASIPRAARESGGSFRPLNLAADKPTSKRPQWRLIGHQLSAISSLARPPDQRACLQSGRGAGLATFRKVSTRDHAGGRRSHCWYA